MCILLSLGYWLLSLLAQLAAYLYMMRVIRIDIIIYRLQLDSHPLQIDDYTDSTIILFMVTWVCIKKSFLGVFL
jgi:hypothetical protein